MGLDAKDIQHRLWRVVQVSSHSSYTFVQKHPLVSSVLLVCLILYIFLSYIYSFLAYLSPFLVCAAIFVRIFWSSEQTQFKYVKIEEEKIDHKIIEALKIPSNGRRELHKYPSQNAINRRRNYKEKKWDVYEGLEERARNLSAVFQNEFNSKNTDIQSFDREESSSLNCGLVRPKSLGALRHEPSMRDLMECGIMAREKTEDDGDEEDEEDRNKIVEWTESDQRNLMDLGISELERNQMLEGLMAKRKEKKPFKLEDKTIEKTTETSSHMAPLHITKGNPFDTPRSFEGIDGLEIPASAPTMTPRSSFDIPYYPSEEKLKLNEDRFYQEYISPHSERFNVDPYFPSEPIQEHGDGDPYSYYNNGKKNSGKPSPSRFRRPPGKGSHDKKLDQLIQNEGVESGLELIKEPNLVTEGEETTHDDEKESTTYDPSEPSSTTNISNVETTQVPEIPVSTTTTTTTTANNTINEYMNETLPSPFSKRHENIFLRRRCHTPTYSIASDLQVEVSEVGSPTSTVDENVEETNSTSDRDSVLYDGDIDKGVSSGSEELWGASFHGKQSQGVVPDDVGEGNSSKEIVTTPMALRQIEEKNVADVSCMSSRSDMPEDTPTHEVNDDRNIFSGVKYSGQQNEAPQSSISSYVSSPPKQFINSSVDLLHNDTLSEGSEDFVVQGEWSTMSDNIINVVDVNNSATMEHNISENSRSNEVPTTSVVRQESIDAVSIYSIASSPRSVLPEKSTKDEIPSSTYDEQGHIDAQQDNMEGMPQETLNDEEFLPDTMPQNIQPQETLNDEECSPETMPQNIQPLMDATLDESHNVAFHSSQDQTNPPENSMEGSKTFDKKNDVGGSNIEEQDETKNGENSEDNSQHLTMKEVTSQTTTLIEMTATEDMDQKSREIVDDKVPSDDGDENDNPTSSNVHEDLSQPSVTELPALPRKEAAHEEQTIDSSSSAAP